MPAAKKKVAKRTMGQRLADERKARKQEREFLSKAPAARSAGRPVGRVRSTPLEMLAVRVSPDIIDRLNALATKRRKTRVSPWQKQAMVEAAIRQWLDVTEHGAAAVDAPAALRAMAKQLSDIADAM